MAMLECVLQLRAVHSRQRSPRQPAARFIIAVAIMREDILRIAAAVNSAVDLTEGEFLEVGRRLATSVEVLQRLTTQFGTLRVELESHEMQGAADSLLRVAEQVSGFAHRAPG
jgi:hypothetical protein